MEAGSEKKVTPSTGRAAGTKGEAAWDNLMQLLQRRNFHAPACQKFF
jgi:hypothetical protein